MRDTERNQAPCRTPLSAGPPPVYSDRVYDYPADPPPRPPWLTPVAIIGACVAVIALVIAAVALVVRPCRDRPPSPRRWPRRRRS